MTEEREAVNVRRAREAVEFLAAENEGRRNECALLRGVNEQLAADIAAMRPAVEAAVEYTARAHTDEAYSRLCEEVNRYVRAAGRV